MDASELNRKLRELMHRFRYAVLVLLIGLALMMLPEKQAGEPPAPEPIPPAGLQQELEKILSAIEGAGKTKVLLTERTGPEIHYQTDVRRDSDGSGSSEQQDTVLIDDESRNQLGLVRRRDPPGYLGALVVCQGADSPRVRLAVMQAVQCVTGLRSDQIQVVKMK